MVRQVPFVVNVRKNNNMNSSTYGNYYYEADTKETLNLKGFAKHLVEHGKLTDYGECVQFLQSVVYCLKELLKQNQPVKLDGLGIFRPGIINTKGGYQSIQAAVDDLPTAQGIKGVRINFAGEASGDEEDKMTSTAMKNQCTFVAGYSVTSQKYTTSGGKQATLKKKVSLNSILHPEQQPEP